MALPYYNPSVPSIPGPVCFRVVYDGVYDVVYDEVYEPRTGMNYGTLTMSDLGMDLSSKHRPPVETSRARKCWDEIWAKPKRWWSTHSDDEKEAWKHLLWLLFFTVIISVVVASAWAVKW